MNEKFGKGFILVVSVILLIGLPASAGEKDQKYPSKPIKIIVPYAPGSGADINARRIAPGVGKYLGVRTIIEDKPGADGRLALNELWKTQPDGYTLLTTGMPAPIINERFYSVDYKFSQFVQIYSWAQDNMILVVNSETWKTPEDFLEAARSRTLSGGLSGIGSVSQVAGVLLEDKAHLKPVNWVAFGGGSQTMASLAGKHIDFGITTSASAKGLVDAGKLRTLLVFAAKRDPLFPDAALLKDIGIKDDISPLLVVRLVFGPPRLSPTIARILEKAFSEAAREPEFLAWAKTAEVEISPMNSKECTDYVMRADKEITKYLEKIKVKK